MRRRVLAAAICWLALEQGQSGGFLGYARTAVALREFAENAGLAR